MILSFFRSIKVLITIYLTGIVLIIYLGYTYYRDNQAIEIEERSKELSSISNLKNNAINNWYFERLADAEYLFNNEPIRNSVKKILKTVTVSDSLNLVGSISTMFKNHDYSNIWIKNNSGKTIVNLNPSDELHYFNDSLESAVKQRKIVFADFYIGEKNKTPLIDIYVPVVSNENYLGMIIMNINPEKLIFPIISNWYLNDSTGESYILKYKDNNAIYISPLRNSGTTQVVIKNLSTDKKLLAAKIFNGQIGLIDGMDYRGSSVISYVQKINNLPWFLVTKLDRSEVLVPVKKNAMTDIYIFSLVAFLGGLLLLYYHTRIEYNSLKKISETEQKLKDILNYSTNAFYSHTPDHVLTYISPQSYTILGYTPDELKIKWTELTTDNPVNLKGLEFTNLAIKTGKTQSPYELELIKKNGEKVWVEVREAPVIRNGKTIAIVGALTDITKRKQAEEKLNVLSKAVEQSPVSVIITDPEGKIQYVNSAFTQVTGYTMNEVINLTPRILKSGKQLVDVYKDLWNTILSGGTWRGELENKKKDGSLFWEYVSISPIINEDNIITNFISVKEDITDQKKHLEILRENEEKFRLVFDNSNEALFLTRPDGTIEAANPAACKMFQYTEQELISIGRDIILDTSDQNFKLYLQERERKGKTKGELTCIRKDGESFIGELSSAIFKDKDGNLRTSTIVRDVTERKKIEQNFVTAKEKAEEASHIKSNFLATMSHELRTPLVGILGYAELLSKELNDPEQIDMAETILQSGNRLLETLNSILDISRIEANKLEYTIKSLNLIEVLQESVNLFRPLAQSKNIGLITYYPEVSVLLKSDKELLLRIFNNLISNAIKYTSSGNIKVKVSIEDINSLKYTVIDIIDTGIGISDNFHDIVFEPFRQVSEGLSRIFEGTGLGLAITKRLVEILNGSITFVSIPGKGSTFTVRFPFTSDDNFSKTVNQRKISNHLKTKNNKLPSEIKILVVEDDISNALMIKTYIEDYFTVEHVINGYDAIEKCRSRQYDGILMDINLKGIDGVETFKHIRLLNDHYSQVPVVAVTAYAMKGDKEKFMAYGFDQYISKPFKQSELLDKMFGVLNLKPG